MAFFSVPHRLCVVQLANCVRLNIYSVRDTMEWWPYGLSVAIIISHYCLIFIRKYLHIFFLSLSLNLDFLQKFHKPKKWREMAIVRCSRRDIHLIGLFSPSECYSSRAHSKQKSLLIETINSCGKIPCIQEPWVIY